MRPATAAAALLAGIALAGCSLANPCGANPCQANPCQANPCQANPCHAGAAPDSALPAPAAGTAWRVVGGEGSLRAQGTVPPGGAPVVWIDGSGNIRASIPASAETQQAGAALAPGTFGALQLRNAP